MSNFLDELLPIAGTVAGSIFGGPIGGAIGGGLGGMAGNMLNGGNMTTGLEAGIGSGLLAYGGGSLLRDAGYGGWMGGSVGPAGSGAAQSTGELADAAAGIPSEGIAQQTFNQGAVDTALGGQGGLGGLFSKEALTHGWLPALMGYGILANAHQTPNRNPSGQQQLPPPQLAGPQPAQNIPLTPMSQIFAPASYGARPAMSEGGAVHMADGGVSLPPNLMASSSPYVGAIATSLARQGVLPGSNKLYAGISGLTPNTVAPFPQPQQMAPGGPVNAQMSIQNPYQGNQALYNPGAYLSNPAVQLQAQQMGGIPTPQLMAAVQGMRGTNSPLAQQISNQLRQRLYTGQMAGGGEVVDATPRGMVDTAKPSPLNPHMDPDTAMAVNVIAEARAALQGEHPHGEEAIARLVDMFGPAALSELKASLGDRGGKVTGAGDGMADLVPGSIDGDQPVQLATDEHVIPADVVSHLGNGSSEAGHRLLKEMTHRVRRDRTGTSKQAPQVNGSEYLPG